MEIKESEYDVDESMVKEMLDVAIHELVEIAEENEIYLVDNLYFCTTHDDIFNYLKHRVEKLRKQRNEK